MKHKLIIAGSRSITNYQIVKSAILESGLWAKYGANIEVVSGKAPGVDALGEEFAKKAKLEVRAKPADWDNIKAKGAVVRYNKAGKPYNAVAGHWRNEEMAQMADGALIVWDGRSTGSLDMLHRMIDLGKGENTYLYPIRIGTDALDRLSDKDVHIILPNRYSVLDSDE